MSTWTEAARQELERYFGRVRATLAASGADANEVIDDLRRHLEQEAAAAELEIVTEEDVRRLLARIGAPEPGVAGTTHSSVPAPAAEPTSQPSPPAPAPAVAPNPRPSAAPGLGRGASGLAIAFGMVLPVVALLLEWSTGMCAGVFFDPLPTLWHVGLVAFVPLANALLWHSLTRPRGRPIPWLGWAGGVAAGVGLCYALMFLPLLLPGLIGVIFYGLGLLPWAPLLAFIVTLRLNRQLRHQSAGTQALVRSRVRGLWPGFAAGVAALVLLELPETLTRHGLRLAMDEEPAIARRGIARLRSWGDREVLLRECYGRTPGAANMDLLALLVEGGRRPGTDKVREVYYRVTGRPFNSVPAPRVRTARGPWGGLDDWTWDRDQAGDRVGGRLKGLTLHSSRLDALVEPDAALGYLEWTVEFKNDSPRQREARTQILLPPGSVVSRLTLWVNGEEREAAFAGRSQVRQAYESIVRRRQDPVLVTSAGPDRVLMQCFPVPPDGGTMKVRLGMTVPLELMAREKGRLRWPQMIERNFTVPQELRHSLWVEGAGAFSAPGSLFHIDQPKTGWHAARAQAREADLASARNFLEVARNPSVQEVWTRDTRGAEPGIVRQSLRTAVPSPPGRVVVVVDGSQNMAPHLPAIAEALAEVPKTIDCSLIVAGDEPVRLGSLAADADVRTRLAQWRAAGGRDNLPALVEAWDWAADKAGSVILWIHGPVPVVLQSAEALRQRYERRPNGPRLLELAAAPGPNRILEQLDRIATAESLPRTDDLPSDLKALLGSWAGHSERLVWERQRLAADSPAPAQAPEASLHLARLWARDEIGRLIAARKADAAIDLAGRYQLVTAVSGAVVLETAQQYKEHGLEPVDASTVPSIPEPQTWAMLILGTGFLLVVLRRRRGAGTAGRRTVASVLP